ncbi:MAG TPA: TIGR03668 family PPOX class F420-dependent oxidoreductase [Acidimicrobiales bacterium]|nr:TIGR03668 family PPOX class F420-dependent oxidoreductase [Acidimicrobiales bacterium]
MDPGVARRLVEEARVARLATVSPEGRPHLVPCCFVLVAEVAYTAVDAKPKSTLALRRVANIRSNPEVSLLVDRYEEDWSLLWWVRLDGRARIVEDVEEAGSARAALRAKYPQYGRVAMPGPIIAVEVARSASWP